MATGWPGTDTFTTESPNWPDATKARPVAGSMATSLAAPTAGTNPTSFGLTEPAGPYVTWAVAPEETRRGGSGHVAGRIPVPGVARLGPVAAAHRVGDAAVIARGGGPRHPARRGGGGPGRAGRQVVAGHPDVVRGRKGHRDRRGAS